MFLNLLTEAQKRAFLAMATKLVLADGTVAPAESVALELRRTEMGGDITAPPEQIYGAPDTAAFDTRTSQTIALLELYVLADSDECIHIDERQILSDLGREWGFSQAELADVETWATREAPLGNAAWDLLSRLGAAA